MKKLLILTFITILSTSLMVACGSVDTNEEGNLNNEKVNDEISNDAQDESIPEIEEIENEEANENVGEDNSNADSPSNFEDQEDLSLGDIAQVSDNLGEYSIVVESVSIENEVGGETSPGDYFIVANVSYENIGSSILDAEDISKALELAYDMEGSGYSNLSANMDGSEHISGDIESGDTVSGELVFYAFDEEEYLIRISSGLIASGAVNNQVIWSFDKSEAE